MPNAVESIALLTKAGYEIYVVSNQGCVARGLISSEELARLTARMQEEIRAGGGKISGVFYCEHRTDSDCECKKPKLGLFKQALQGKKDVDLKSVFFIGDAVMDVEAGKALGCRTVLVLSGRATLEEVERWAFQPDFIKQDLWEAANWILQEKS